MSKLPGNIVRLKRLTSVGAVWPDLLDEIADIQDSKNAPHVSMFFQLPYLIELGAGLPGCSVPTKILKAGR
jgi:hypothetical protein